MGRRKRKNTMPSRILELIHPKPIAILNHNHWMKPAAAAMKIASNPVIIAMVVSTGKLKIWATSIKPVTMTRIVLYRSCAGTLETLKQCIDERSNS